MSKLPNTVEAQRLRATISAFSKYLLTASDDLGIERVRIYEYNDTIAKKPTISLELTVSNIDGKLFKVYVRNLLQGDISRGISRMYYAMGQNSADAREFVKVGLRGDARSIEPHVDSIINALISFVENVDADIAEIEWDVNKASRNDFSDLQTLKTRNGDYLMKFHSKEEYYED